MGMGGGLNQHAQSENVFPSAVGATAANPQYMDQQAKEKWLREQSSLTYSQEDNSNDGTFLKLSADNT